MSDRKAQADGTKALVDRKVLLEALEAVKPALAVKAQVEEFACIWLNGKTAMAYNDTDLGIEVPFDSGLRGGLRGSILLGVLGASRAREVEFADGKENGELQIKAGGTRLNMPLFPPDKAVWEFPVVKKDTHSDITKDMLQAVADVMLSAGDPEPSVPEKLGITFEQLEDWVDVYTTDSVTVAASSFAAPKGFKTDRVTIPTAFWSEVLRRCKEGGKLWLLPDCAIAESPDGVRMFTKLVNVEKPIEFADTVDRSLPKGWKKSRFAVPEKLPLAFERACVVLEGNENEYLRLTIADGTLRMEAKTVYGEVKDSMKLEHPAEDVEVNLDPVLVSRGLKTCKTMLVTKDCACLFGEGDFVYLVSACL